MPDYLDPRVLSRIKGYELRSRRLVESFMAGMHKSKLLGISTEFAQHRQYVPGDETKHLDWKVYAKTDRYYVKQYEAETNMQVVFLLDASNSMFFRSDEAAMSKFDYAATVLASMSYLLMQQKDAFGLALYDEKVRTFLPPKGSHTHFRNLTDVLDKTTAGPETDLADVCLTIAPQLKRRSLIIVISDFITDLDRLGLGLGQISFGGHDMVLFHVEDPLERDFHFAGQTIFIGKENEGRLLCEPRDLRNAYLKSRRKHLGNVRRTALQFGYEVEDLPTDARLDESLSKFLATRLAKRRQR
ncbi:MAG: DUF58 domain-containing protein [Planctomycetales bacterium]